MYIVANLRKLFAACIVAFAAATPLSSEGFRINAGLWLGPHETELEERFFLDDLLLGTSFGRLNLDWSGPGNVGIYPLGVEYEKSLGQGKLILGLNIFGTRDDTRYTGLSTSAISNVTLQDFSIRDLEAYGGYRFSLGDSVVLTPFLGVRARRVVFNYRQTSFGTNTIITDLEENYWNSGTVALFVGAELLFKLNPTTGLFVDVMSSPPVFALSGGALEHERVLGGFSGNSTALTFERAQAGFEMDLRRFALGLEFALREDISLRTGIRHEALKVSYPGYFNIPFIFNGNSGNFGFSFEEFATDLFVYESERTSSKGTLFVSVAIRI